MRKLFVILAFLSAALVSPAIAHQVDDTDEASILTHGGEWSRLFEAGNIDAMRDLYETDAWLMTHGAPAKKGVDAILAYLKSAKATAGTVAFDISPEQVIIDGHYGFLISRYWMDIQPAKGRNVTQAGRSMLIYKKGADGKWRIWRDIDNQAPDVTAKDRPSAADAAD